MQWEKEGWESSRTETTHRGRLPICRQIDTFLPTCLTNSIRTKVGICEYTRVQAQLSTLRAHPSNPSMPGSQHPHIKLGIGKDAYTSAHYPYGYHERPAGRAAPGRTHTLSLALPLESAGTLVHTQSRIHAHTHTLTEKHTHTLRFNAPPLLPEA
ncbi:hypothetical protein LX36DRAFT_482770 [Colletotrichum falcatum]|nr:hypothetical protein LX36DRAFT_482770 [Colletotrichum falcatum]